jgi:hypothetical protein
MLITTLPHPARSRIPRKNSVIRFIMFSNYSSLNALKRD